MGLLSVGVLGGFLDRTKEGKGFFGFLGWLGDVLMGFLVVVVVVLLGLSCH